VAITIFKWSAAAAVSAYVGCGVTMGKKEQSNLIAKIKISILA